MNFPSGDQTGFIPRVATPRSLRSTHRITRRCMQPGAAESTRARTGVGQNSLVDQIADLVIDPSNPRRLLAGFKSVYQSINGAENWGTLMTPEDDYSASYYPPRLSAIAFAPYGPPRLKPRRWVSLAGSAGRIGRDSA